MLIRETMSAHLEAVVPNTTVRECAREMDRLGVGALPVCENGQVVGIVTDRDVCCRAVGSGRDPATMTAREVMTGDVVVCFEDQDCTEAARLMQQKHVRRLPVTNRNRTTVGIFSVDDLARYSRGLAGEVLEAIASWPH